MDAAGAAATARRSSRRCASRRESADLAGAKLYGDDPTRRGAGGSAHQRHLLPPSACASFPLLGALASRRACRSRATDTTLFRGGSGPWPRFLRCATGAAYRGLYDLADLERSRFITVPGQSGKYFRVRPCAGTFHGALGAMALPVTIPAACSGPCGRPYHRRGPRNHAVTGQIDSRLPRTDALARALMQGVIGRRIVAWAGRTASLISASP